MWKKDDGQDAQPTTDSAARQATGRTATVAGRAIIGRSISIKGDVSGSEDLLIQGTIDGSVDLGAHAVSVGSEGRVNANVRGRVITVEGQVEGDLTAQEQIVLRGTAKVLGDIKAPRVVLEDGATFRGLVDMGSLGADQKSKSAASERDAKAGAAPAKADSTRSEEKSASGPSSKVDTKSEPRSEKASASAGRSANGATTATVGASSEKGKGSPDTAGQARA